LLAPRDAVKNISANKLRLKGFRSVPAAINFQHLHAALPATMLSARGRIAPLKR